MPLIEGGFDSREVRRAARQIASTMVHCRVEALSKSEPQELVINPERNTIATTRLGPLGSAHRPGHHRASRRRSRGR